ncbi:SGNH/GDSL hydrolase family protein [Actinomadura sp. NPDC047616]|uniref:SGNH/GDSL hydrolase family protein n=1 Tax=Actinomadura sp. NPDC047616 TaxID=3155914 RepID=UPI003408467B
MPSTSDRRVGSAVTMTGAVPATASDPVAAGRAWTAAWTTSPQRPGTGFAPNWSEQGFADQTVRQVVRLSIGGDTIRVRLSNAYGTEPLVIAGATVALSAGGAAVHADTLRHLTANGSKTFTIAAGAEQATDAVPFEAAGLDSVAVTLYLAAPTGPATHHEQALATSYRSARDHRADTGGAAFTETSQSWYYLSGIDVTGGPALPPGIVVFGDSLTDGTGSSPDGNNRFSDALAERLAAAGRPRAVLNQGIGGNRVTVDSAWFGDRATARFARDVLGQPAVGTVIILLGINDIGMSEVAEASPFPTFAPYTDVSAEEVIAGYRDMIRQAHAAGLRAVGATVMPAKPSAFSTLRSESKRTAINTWIRTSGAYDAVVDLDRALRSPSAPDTLDPAFDSGDHLHLNDAGYRAMADAIDLADLA